MPRESKCYGREIDVYPVSELLSDQSIANVATWLIEYDNVVQRDNRNK